MDSTEIEHNALPRAPPQAISPSAADWAFEERLLTSPLNLTDANLDQKKMQTRPNGLNFSFLILSAIAIAFVPASTSHAGDAQQTKTKPYEIAIDFAKGSQTQILGEYEYEGSVIVIPEAVQASPDDKPKAQKAQTLPLRVAADLHYFQRSTGSGQAVRLYDSAIAKIKLDTGAVKPELELANRLVIARLKDKPSMRVEMASIKDMLNQKEYELLQTAADPLSLPMLFSKKRAAVGDNWKPDLDALAKFLNVDKIITTDVKMNLKAVENGIARVYVSGGVTANQYDVTSEISLAGFAVINLKTKQVQSVKLSTDERCPPGQISPGFEGRTRIDVSFKHGVETAALSNKALSEVMRSSRIAQRLKFESKQGSYRITYDPRWKLIAGESDTAIMRFIDQGELLSQCTVVMLPRRAANQPLTLDKYKREIARVIEGDSGAKLVKSDETVTEAGVKAMSVVVASKEDGLPVNWIYYHLEAKDGRQMTFVFTLAESVAPRVVGVASQLINEFEFLSAQTKVAKKPKSNVYKAPK